MKLPLALVPAILLALVTGPLSPGLLAEESVVDYARDIAPILRVHCVGCHDSTDPEGDFAVTTYAELRRGGERGDPIVPGDPDHSFLILSIEGKERPKMPPRKEPPLPDAARELLRRWVAQGAKGPEKDVSLLERLVTRKLPPAKLPAAPITAAAHSPSGHRLALGRFRSVEIRDASSYELLRVIEDLPGKVHHVEFVAGESELLVASGVTGLSGEARRISLESGETLQTYGGHRDILYDATITPDGQIVATAGYDRKIRLFQAGDATLLREIDTHKGAIFDLEFSPDGQVLASASADETVKLWRVRDGLRLDTLNQPQGEQRAVRFTADGQHILSVGNDRRIHHWRLVSRTEPGLNPVVQSRFAHESPIVALEFARDAAGHWRVLTAAADRSLKAWTWPDLLPLATYPAQSGRITSILPAVSPEAFRVSRLDGTLETFTLPRSRATGEKSPSTPGTVVREVAPGPLTTVNEEGEADTPETALRVPVPVMVKGRIERRGDVDLFRFSARAGERLAVETHAARRKSQVDTRIEILHPDGQPVEQVVLEATRDSWFTFRGKDSNTSDDFRVHNWREMELDEYLYASGEVVKLWLYPRGPDSGFKVYPGSGQRHGFFFTTPLSHPLGEPCYIVRPLPPGSRPVASGLPVFRLHYENDDGPWRRRGRDSFLIFTAPRDGDYLVRVRDVRGFGGPENHHYELTVRAPRPDFSIAVGGKNPKVSPGGSREITLTATRKEGFDGPIRVDFENVPEGFQITTPVTIEAGQIQAKTTLHAEPGAAAPTPELASRLKITARGEVGQHELSHQLGDLGKIELAGPARVLPRILPSEESGEVPRDEKGRYVFTLRPSETIQLRVQVDRNDFGGRIDFGKDDAGRNLPHGLYVDNIGLNGLLIVEGQTERDFFITASAIARPGRRVFHLRAAPDGGQCSLPAVIEVLPARSSVLTSSSGGRREEF